MLCRTQKTSLIRVKILSHTQNTLTAVIEGQFMCEYADEWRYPPGVDRLPNRWSRIYEQINFERMTRGLMYHSKGWVDIHEEEMIWRGWDASQRWIEYRRLFNFVNAIHLAVRFVSGVDGVDLRQCGDLPGLFVIRKLSYYYKVRVPQYLLHAPRISWQLLSRGQSVCRSWWKAVCAEVVGDRRIDKSILK